MGFCVIYRYKEPLKTTYYFTLFLAVYKNSLLLFKGIGLIVSSLKLS